MSFPSVCYYMSFTGTQRRAETKPSHRERASHSNRGLVEDRPGPSPHDPQPAGSPPQFKYDCSSHERESDCVQAGKGTVCQDRKHQVCKLPVWEPTRGAPHHSLIHLLKWNVSLYLNPSIVMGVKRETQAVGARGAGQRGLKGMAILTASLGTRTHHVSSRHVCT